MHPPIVADDILMVDLSTAIFRLRCVRPRARSWRETYGELVHGVHQGELRHVFASNLIVPSSYVALPVNDRDTDGLKASSSDCQGGPLLPPKSGRAPPLRVPPLAVGSRHLASDRPNASGRPGVPGQLPLHSGRPAPYPTVEQRKRVLRWFKSVPWSRTVQATNSPRRWSPQPRHVTGPAPQGVPQLGQTPPTVVPHGHPAPVPPRFAAVPGNRSIRQILPFMPRGQLAVRGAPAPGQPALPGRTGCNSRPGQKGHRHAPREGQRRRALQPDQASCLALAPGSGEAELGAAGWVCVPDDREEISVLG
ncbi:hypothetical protein BDK51DRAFT_46331 [Blyttiomyces helicus]|uniref:Uncharacterized protein n=1 Tax=Blyttiomyces helicus TaxID=388810 RepID=A0A4P9WG62_9FUNG|nr:hypothetical protein BDK51DRAFT_46331 [Blyttiomyces helicus]|eukprot:RKO90793.1 hypothetical protein BDK51DRAFT_46331 [Blyttiomyces helicus]